MFPRLAKDPSWFPEVKADKSNNHIYFRKKNSKRLYNKEWYYKIQNIYIYNPQVDQKPGQDFESGGNF